MVYHYFTKTCRSVNNLILLGTNYERDMLGFVKLDGGFCAYGWPRNREVMHCTFEDSVSASSFAAEVGDTFGSNMRLAVMAAPLNT